MPEGDEEITARVSSPPGVIEEVKMSKMEERIATVRGLESVASDTANDATTRKIASDMVINLRLLIQSHQDN